jgi:hypothetical protein
VLWRRERTDVCFRRERALARLWRPGMTAGGRGMGSHWEGGGRFSGREDSSERKDAEE